MVQINNKDNNHGKDEETEEYKMQQKILQRKISKMEIEKEEEESSRDFNEQILDGNVFFAASTATTKNEIAQDRYVIPRVYLSSTLRTVRTRKN